MAYGDILNANVDQVQVEGTYYGKGQIIKLSDNYVAIEYLNTTAASPKGRIKTYHIADDGTITLVDDWQWAPVYFNGSDSEWVHIANDIYAIVMQGFTTSGYARVITVQISPTGVITKSLIGSIFLYAMSNAWFRIKRLGETNTYVVASHISGNDGFMNTININPDGTGLASLDSWEYDPANGYFTNMLCVQGNYVLFAHQSEVCTVYVADNGTITKSLVSTVADGNIYKAVILPLSGTDKFAIFNDGNVVKTYSVSAAGALAAIGSFSVGPGYEPWPVRLGLSKGGLNYFGITCRYDNTYGDRLYTISINDAGDTFANLDDWKEGVPPPYCTGQCIVKVKENSNLYARIWGDSGGANAQIVSTLLDSPPDSVSGSSKSPYSDLIAARFI